MAREDENYQAHLKKYEKEWLNVLFNKNNSDSLIYANSYGLIASSESELEQVLDKKRIKKLNTKDDNDLIDLASNYFLSVYNVPKAFNLVTHNKAAWILTLISLSLLFFLGALFFLGEQSQILEGFFITIIPTILFIFSIYLFLQNKASISILLMPRLSFSILLSWTAIVASFDLFYAHIHHEFWSHLIINFFILFILYFAYKMKIKENANNKIISILLVAMFISLVQGYFFVKFHFATLIQRAYTDESFQTFQEVNKSVIKNYPYIYMLKNGEEDIKQSEFKIVMDIPRKGRDTNTTQQFIFKTCQDLNIYDRNNSSEVCKGVSNFLKHFIIDVYVLFALFLLPVFFGLILHNVTDDKSIFKPLQ
jgi:hypothetical protein